ncbi:MAG: hypothetical protein ACOH2D_05950 [Gelidibacter sp.]
MYRKGAPASLEISKAENRSLHTFSSGERRKLLLEYCLEQKPDYIISDIPLII